MKILVPNSGFSGSADLTV